MEEGYVPPIYRVVRFLHNLWLDHKETVFVRSAK